MLVIIFIIYLGVYRSFICLLVICFLVFIIGMETLIGAFKTVRLIIF